MKKSKNFFYKTCQSLPVLNFYQVLITKDLSWLHKDHRMDDDPMRFSEEEVKELNALWFEIICEYSDLLGEKVNTTNFTIVAQIAEISNEIDIVGSLISFYEKNPTEAVKKAILDWKYYPDDIDKSKKKLNKLAFKVTFLKNKHKDLFPEEKEEEEKIEYDLYNDVVMLEQSLGNGTSIDPARTVVAKWVKMIILSEKKRKKIEESRRKIKRR